MSKRPGSVVSLEILAGRDRCSNCEIEPKTCPQCAIDYYVKNHKRKEKENGNPI